MQPTIFHRIFTFSDGSWPQLLVRWLGHLWTDSTQKLSQLNHRISDAVQEVFCYLQKRDSVDSLTVNHKIELLTPPKNDSNPLDELKGSQGSRNEKW